VIFSVATNRLSQGRNSARIRNNGFTVLEMLLVLAIAVIAMMVVLPNLSRGLAAAEMRSATRDIASSLRYSRGYAIASGKESEFNIDVKSNRYSVSGRTKQYAVSDTIQLKLLTVDAEIKNEGQGVIRFYPDGSSTGGRITLETEDRTRIVDINWLTGQIEIFVE